MLCCDGVALLNIRLLHAVYQFLSCNHIPNYQALRDEWMTLTVDKLLEKNIMSKRNNDELQNVFVRVGKNSKSTTLYGKFVLKTFNGSLFSFYIISFHVFLVIILFHSPVLNSANNLYFMSLHRE